MAKELTATVDDFGELHLESRSDGWPGSGFKRSITQVDIRRVVHPEQGDQVQIQIKLTKIKGESERAYDTFGSLTIPAADVQQLLDHLTNDRSKFMTDKGRQRLGIETQAA